jgi:multidrug efflux pump subunit AcrA (membrane-fusion protein)
MAAVRDAELNLSYTRVTAPVAGISGRAERSIGSLITPDANGSLLTTIRSFTNVDATADWTAFAQPLQGSFAGVTVRLRIIGATDNVLATKFLVDTLSLEATVCP